MKKELTILILIIGICLKAQLPTDELIHKTWYLKSMESPFLNPFFNYLENSEYNEITLNFYLQNDTLKYTTTVCSTKSGIVKNFESNENPIIFENSIITGNPCIDTETKNFESLYFSHIFDEEYWLYITQNSDETYWLTLSSPSFCSATFVSQSLSNKEFSKSKFLIYPNPVKENLTIENTDNQNFEIKIVDISGKLILKQKINSASTDIDFSKFSNGIYFISIESKNKIIQSNKIIKN